MNIIFSHCLAFLSAICHSECGSVTWYEPPPEVTTLDNDEVLIPTNRSLQEGQVANLSWNFTLSSGLNLLIVTINFNGEQAAAISPSTNFFGVSSKFKGQFNVSWISQRATLSILNVTDAEDKGEFECVLNTYEGADNNFWKRKVQVKVVAPALITSTTKNPTVIEGLTLILFCNATGKPVPTITWSRVLDDGTDSQVLFNGNPMIIANISRTATGTYRCTADNGIGIPVNRTVFVDVNFKPDDVTLETNITEMYDCVGLWVNFTCNTIAANPLVHNYLLLKNESEISFSATGTWIEKITRGETFVYSCVAYQQVDNVTSTTDVTVKGNDPPAVEQVQNATVKEGTDVTKECNVTTGTPPLTIFWENVKSGQITAGKLLNIASITRHQTEYRCVAKNTCGSVSTTMFIDVQYKPSVSHISATIKLELGEDRSIGCPVDVGNPPAVISWYKGNDTSGNKITTSSTLKVQSAALCDQGWYTCLAKNGVGNATVNLLLLVVQTVSSTVATSSQTTPAALEITEVYLTVTILENCSKRAEVAAKFPEMACQIALWFGCSSANTVNTRCGSVLLDFTMRFNQSVVVSNVLSLLSDAARQDQFGVLKVDPDSIKQVFIPSGSSQGTPKGPEECNCSSNNVLLAIIGVLAFTILLLVIYIIWLHWKGAVGRQRTYEDERGVYDVSYG